MKKIFLLTFLVLLLIITGCNQTVTVEFYSNGGTEVDSVVVPKGTPVEEPESPIKDGFEFIAWFYNGRRWNFDDPVNEDIRLIAQYYDL